MPGFLPAIRGSSQSTLYPVTMVISFDTHIGYNQAGSEQRWKRRAPLFRFQLKFSSLLAADKTAETTFFDNQAGMFDSFALSLAGTTYGNLVLDQDELAFAQRENLLFDTELVLHQTQNRQYPANAPLAAFPTLANGLTAELPFIQRRRWLTSKTDQASGTRYAYKWYGAGLQMFPATALLAWDLQFPVLKDADATTLINAFVGWDGMAASFSFTDPISNTTYANCRMGSDELTVKYLDFNRTSIAMTVVQTNG